MINAPKLSSASLPSLLLFPKKGEPNRINRTKGKQESCHVSNPLPLVHPGCLPLQTFIPLRSVFSFPFESATKSTGEQYLLSCPGRSWRTCSLAREKETPRRGLDTMNFRFKSKSRQMEVDAFHSMENGTLSPFFPMRGEKVLNKALLQDEEEDGSGRWRCERQLVVRCFFFFFLAREICLGRDESTL